MKSNGGCSKGRIENLGKRQEAAELGISDGQYLFGNCLLNGGEQKEGLKWLKAAVSKWHNAAKRELGDYLIDNRHQTEGLRLRPDSAKAVRRIGDALAEKGNFKKATKYFQQAVDMNPLDVKNHSKLASAFEFQGRYNEAAEQLRTGIRIMSENGRKDDAAELQKHLELIEDTNLDNK